MEGEPQNGKQCLGSEHATSLIRTSSRPFRRENLTGFLQEQKCFSTLLAYVPVLLIEESLLLIEELFLLAV